MNPKFSIPRLFKHLIRLQIALGLTLFACQNNGRQTGGAQPAISPDLPPVHWIDLKIDSMLAVPLRGKYAYFEPGFMFSPFEKDRVWICPEDSEAFEIELKTGGKTRFADKFKHPFFEKPLRVNRVYPDAFDPEVCWFFDFSHGVFRFDRSRQAGAFFEIPEDQNFTSAAFSGNYAWIGTTKALWNYDRHSGKFRAVEYSPEMSIGSIKVLAQDKVGVLGHPTADEPYTYDPTSGCWEKWVGGEKSRTETASGFSPIPGIPFVGSNYKTAMAPTEMWSCNDTYCFSCPHNQPKVYPFRPPLAAEVHSLLVDSDNLYLLYADTFLIVSKTYLSKSRAGDPLLFQKLARLKALDDSLQLFQPDPWPVRKAKLEYLEKQFPGETDPYISAHFHQVAQIFSLPQQEDSLRVLLSAPGTDTLVWNRAFAALYETFIHNGKLRPALALFRAFERKPSAMVLLKRFQKDLPIVQTALHQLDSIDQAQPSEDENLWAKGKTMEWFCSNYPGFSNEASCYNYALADSIFRRLLHRFPQSSRADDADHALIIHGICNEGEDGSNHPEEVAAWKKFLQKYPDTEFKAGVLCAMAWALGRELPDLYQGRQWIAEAEKLRPDLFSQENQMNCLGIKAEFQERLDWMELQFRIRLKKDQVRAGAPVFLEFSVNNTSRERKTLKGFTDKRYPNFSLTITPSDGDQSCIRPVAYIESATSAYGKESAYGERTLEAGKTYVETWDITKTAHKVNAPFLGAFVFDRPGTYLIKAKWRFGLEEKEAEAVRLVVE